MVSTSVAWSEDPDSCSVRLWASCTADGRFHLPEWHVRARGQGVLARGDHRCSRDGPGGLGWCGLVGGSCRRTIRSSDRASYPMVAERRLSWPEKRLTLAARVDCGMSTVFVTDTP